MARLQIPSEDTDFILEDTGVPVSHTTDGGETFTGLGILDQPQRLIQDGMVITTLWTLVVEAQVFGGLLYGDGLTVDGDNFLVREAIVTNDGVFAQLSLEKIAPMLSAPGRHPTNDFGLADLNDTNISNPEEGEILVFDDNGILVNEDGVDGGGA